MTVSVINLKEKADRIRELHAYKVVAKMNDYYFKLVKAKREFIWHRHPETDEVFLVLDGSLTIELRDGAIVLEPGEMAVIPKGVEHKPVCREECTILLIEPAATVNTGDAGGDLTDTDLEWI
ncbi:MAG: cupin domain-containing protein [Thermodesulfobacteriota bacterium]